MGGKSSVFDMIGPVMIGPSSSHTAGVVRIGLAAFGFLGSKPEQVEITFYNSFARTYEGHGSDRAILAGLMGFATHDPRIKTALEIANTEGIVYKFKSVGNASTYHPNTVSLKLTSPERSLKLVGQSLGGGVISIEEIDGYKCHFSTSSNTLVIKAKDIKGSIAFVANVLSQDDCNIAAMTVSRKGKNDEACHVIEMDSHLKPVTLTYLNSLNWIKEVIYLPIVE
jgi:L-serine dehydratase